MARIRKSYYTLAEVAEDCAFTAADLRYVIENGLLRVSVRLVETMLEFGGYELTDADHVVSVSYDRRHHDGLLDLHKRDVVLLLRDGVVAPRHFGDGGDGFARVLRDEDVVAIRATDLLVRGDERRRFEQETLPLLANDTVVYGDFTDFVFAGRRYRFTVTQGRVLGFLYTAAESGREWQPGKAVLAASGSSSLKLCHLFKRHPDWRDLVETDGHGRYRLLLPVRLPLAA